MGHLQILVFISVLDITSITGSGPMGFIGLDSAGSASPPEELPDSGDKKGFSLSPNCIQPPAVCPNENITFWFYTSTTVDNPLQIYYGDENSLKALAERAIKGAPWKLLIHGYTGERNYAPNPELRAEYFKKGKYNIITLDYGPIVREPCYFSSVQNVPLVANCTAQILDELISKGIFKLSEFHVVSFSLGAQVAGHLHLFLKSGRLPRITGLDPAFPLFAMRPLDGKLDSEDAEFVDVIHTNALQKGQFNAIGHVDFYPNGGYSQVGCSSAEYGSVSSCNHARSVVYFGESINSEDGFWGIPCQTSTAYFWGWCAANQENQVIMGEYTPNTTRGTYYLKTKESFPFAMGKQPTASGRSVSDAIPFMN